jgi:Gas vesicle synthesis protein GvpL/GvpF
VPDTATATYVYGVVPKSAGRKISARGVQGADVAPVEHERLTALTSTLQSATLDARDLRAHWRVLEEAFQQGVVLPVRFGTVVESEDAVRREVLDPNADRLSELMEQMSGLVQLNLKGLYDEERLLKAIVASNPKVARLRERVRAQRATAPTPEQLALGQLVDQEIPRWQEADRASVRETLASFAVAVREDEVAHPSAFSVAFLVKRDAMDDFGRGVAALRESFGDRIELRFTGPLPPFSFADADMAMGAGSWA